MNRNLYNFICYCHMVWKGDKRLDKVQNEIRQKLILIGFACLVVLAFIGLVALCFVIKQPEYYSTPLAFL